MNTTTRFAVVCIALCLLATGCQSPGIPEGLRLPGAANMQTPSSDSAPNYPAPDPSTPNYSTPTMQTGGQPTMQTGGQAPAVPSVEQSAAAPPLPIEITQPVASAKGQVSQVGFVQKLRDRRQQCGSCQSCFGGQDCQACQECAPPWPLAPMARPLDPQEFICNGGDEAPYAIVTVTDQIAGLEPQDAITHYTTEAGDIIVQPTNRVCLYSPRFGAVRQVSEAVAGEKTVGLANTYLPIGPTNVGLAEPSLVVEDVDELAKADVARRVDAMRERNRIVPVESIVQPVLAEDALQILATLDFTALAAMNEAQIAILERGALAARTWMIRDAVEVMIESLAPPVLTRDIMVESLVEYDFPDAGRLEVIKVADKAHAPQGDVVTFAIHVRNVGDSPVREVEIADSLIARLEYVEDSQSCDREATFATQTNDAGSLKLFWKLAEPLAVGETAKIEFKCRVR